MDNIYVMNTICIDFSAVTVTPSSFCVKKYIRNHAVPFTPHSITAHLPVVNDLENFQSRDLQEIQLFTIVGGIRPVKNPLFVVNEFSGM